MLYLFYNFPSNDRIVYFLISYLICPTTGQSLNEANSLRDKTKTLQKGVSPFLRVKLPSCRVFQVSDMTFWALVHDAWLPCVEQFERVELVNIDQLFYPN